MKKKKQKTPKTNKPNKKNEFEVSDEDFLNTLDIICKKLVYKFKFGYHDIEDMKQQAAIFALEGLKKYDHSRPLENFLWTHVRNRLFNFKRDNYQRPDKPCLTCPLYKPNNEVSDCAQFRDKLNCHAYKIWYKRNDSKKNIMQPTHMGEHNPSSNEIMFKNIANEELLNQIEDKLPVRYRDIYLKLQHGAKVCKNDKLKLQNYIKKYIFTEDKKDPIDE